MRDVAYESEPVTRLDRFCSEWGEPIVGYCTGLKIADVVRCIVDELRVPYAALVRFLQSLKLSFQEVKPFYIHHNRWLTGGMRRSYIVSSKHAAETMVRHHGVHPVQAIKMVPIQLTRFRRTQRTRNAGRRSPEEGSVRHVREASDR
jgi:hypothetical protein